MEQRGPPTESGASPESTADALASRLERLRAALAGVARGELGSRLVEGGDDTLAAVERTFNEMASSIEARLAEVSAGPHRLQEATSRLGRILSATHDPNQLMRTIVDTALEAARAKGALFIPEHGDVIKAGDPTLGEERLEFPLQARQTRFGTFVLTGDDFGTDERETAASLAAHAVIALENVRLHRLVERQALVDELTGLANRRRCEEALLKELSRAERFGSPVAFVFADLDRFKQVNDEHGHATGDDVLREFATVLRGSIRDIDLAGRWGGEEFVLILPGTDAAGGGHLAERIRRTFEERTILARDGSQLHLTASFGVAAYPYARSRDELVTAADAALYVAKRAGRNRVAAAPVTANRP